MKNAFTILVLACAATGALAESPNAAGATTVQPTSALTRAEVVQQVLDARAAGTLLKAGELGQLSPAMISDKTRAQVQGESLRIDPRRGHANGYQPA